MIFTSIRNFSTRLFSIFCCCIVLFSCDQKKPTPDWQTLGKSAPAATDLSPATTSVVPAQSAEVYVNASDVSSPHGLRFMCYNVENWLAMDRYIDSSPVKDAPKPESEKQAIIKILVRHAPDVIGLSEIGKPEDLADIQNRLKAAGHHFPHSYYTGGSDPTRHLGFLSRFPIVTTVKPAQMEYQLAGRTHAINRGILDATIEVNDKFYRFIGVHLKSKRESEQGDQEEIRMNEARLLRRHVNSIYRDDANARLILYGDFNDTRGTVTFKTITGNLHESTYLTAVSAKDSHGEVWTHHWVPRDIYSRIDFITVSRALRDEVDSSAAKIIDDVEWSEASDHRPLLVIFK